VSERFGADGDDRRREAQADGRHLRDGPVLDAGRGGSAVHIRARSSARRRQGRSVVALRPDVPDAGDPCAAGCRFVPRAVASARIWRLALTVAASAPRPIDEPPEVTPPPIQDPDVEPDDLPTPPAPSMPPQPDPFEPSVPPVAP